jgi:CAAX protease family protein
MSLKTIATRNPVATYFAVTFAISWSGALLAIGGSGGMQGTTPGSDPRFVYALLAMLAGPGVTGILMTALVRGRPGLRMFCSRLFRFQVKAGWYAVAALTAPVVMIATLFALSLGSPSFFPGIFTSSDKTSVLIIGLGVGLSAGIFEELGWTGFAIPVMRQRRSVFATGLVVGIWWSAWHLLPNIWSSRAAAGELAMSTFLTLTAVSVFVGYLTAFRILMAWVYDRTESLFVSMLMHLSFTSSLLILNPLGIAGTHLLTYSLTLAGVLWLVVGIVAMVNGMRRQSQPIWRRAA